MGVPLGPEAWQTMPLVPGIYDAVDYHYYPAFARSCPYRPKPPEDVLAPAFLDEHLRHLAYMEKLRDRYDPGRPLWVSETSTAACGGEPGFSDRFASSFYFLDEIGELAEHGVAVVVRQTLSGGAYSLLDDSLAPRPD